MTAAINLASWGIRDSEHGQRNLAAIRHAVTPDPFATILAHLPTILPQTVEPDRALNNLDRLLAVPAARDRLPAMLFPDGRGLAIVLSVLGTSQFLADTLIQIPETLDFLFEGPQRNPSTAELTSDLRRRVDAAKDDAQVLRAIRTFRQIQTMRVGVNDILRERPLEEITRDLARVADASIEVAVQHSLRSLTKKFGTPTAPDGRTARFTALAFGKLGGDELNYSSDLDLMFVYDEDGTTAGKRGGMSHLDFFSRVAAEVTRLLSSHTDRGIAYRVDLRLRPEGNRGPLARSFASTRSYYDVMGRTWERQALIKLRHVGGDRDLGLSFVEAIQPFVYRKYFSVSEINDVKAMKRQMESRAIRTGVDDRDVKTGRGGIRDIEYTVQFLQLLNGGDLPGIRQRNTLLALEALELAGCLTPQETYILADAYRFLRKAEHRLQLMFDWQTHRLPDSADELRRLARRMGYRSPGPREPDPANRTEATAEVAPQRRSPLDEAPARELTTKPLLVDPLDRFLKDLHDKTSLDRSILDHLLHQTFSESPGQAEPEVDLLLHPDPDPAVIRSTLERYRFRDVNRAFQNLTQLARESVPFLSARRCRHFLASIAPALLRAVAATPDPDNALTLLERVTASLGAKAVLYELFSSNPAALKLYVELCSGSPFLSGLLMNNPGMIDELLDSLVLDRRRTRVELDRELAELLKGAHDPAPILQSFRDKELLRIGVRDLLGKDDIRETTAALSDLAETLLNGSFSLAEQELWAKYGRPLRDTPDGTVVSASYAVLGFGKLGGREISYHSDLDLVVLFDGDGPTEGPVRSTTSHVLTELAQKAIAILSKPGPLGRLYDVDMRLRPFGKSARLVLPLSEFQKYSQSDSCQLWERQAFTRARVVRSEGDFGRKVTDTVKSAITAMAGNAAMALDIRSMRARLDASPGNLKRGPGGIVDIEFIVQLLQLKYGVRHPDILAPNLFDALDAVERHRLMSSTEVFDLRAAYAVLRKTESRLRIVTDKPLTELPEEAFANDTLARRLGFETTGQATATERFRRELTALMTRVRELFQTITAREQNSP